MKKNRQRRAFASVLLSICMILTMLPLTGRAGAYAADIPAGEKTVSEVYELIEEAEADGELDEKMAGSLLDQIRKLLGNPSDILEKVKELLGSPSDFVKKLSELLGIPEGMLEYYMGLLKDPAALLSVIKSMIESYIDKGAITSLIAEATRPEIGQPVAAASLFKVEEGAQYFVERAAYVTDGTESEEKRAFAPYEAFQVRVTFRANEGSRFAGQLFFSMIDDAENSKVEKIERGLGGGASRVYMLVSMRALKQLGPIAEVSMTVDAPLSGQSSADFQPYIETPAEHSYKVGNASWCDASGELLEEDVVFEAGKTYYMIVSLEPDSECWFVKGEGGTSVSVHGATLVSDLNIEVEGYEEGSIYSSTAVLSVTAQEAPEGLINKVNLSLTPPEIGQQYEQNGTESLTPELALSIPEGAPYTFRPSSPRAWFLDNYTQEVITGKFAIENTRYNCCSMILKAREGGSFFKRALVEIENADVGNVELIDAETLGVTFSFVCSEFLNIRICDAAGSIGEGGVVKSFSTDAHGQQSDDEITTEYSLTKNGENGVITLTAVPADGYEFQGWYGFDPHSEDDYENPGPAYFEDQQISTDPVLTYNVVWGGDVNYCAVFRETGASVKLNKETAKLLVGKTLQLKATPADAALTWKSGNTKIAAVSKNGLVTAKAPGTTTIQVKTADGATASCKVTVTFRYVYQCAKGGVYRYTASTNTVKQLKSEGWSCKKAFRAPGFSKTKVYWVYDKTQKRYRYTTNLSYAKKQKAAGNKAGLAFYSADVKTVPVYELRKGTKRVTYFYTMKKDVVKAKQAEGWTYVHVAWYAQPKA